MNRFDHCRPARMSKYSAPDKREWDSYIANLRACYMRRTPDGELVTDEARVQAIAEGRDARSIIDKRRWRELGR